LAVAIKVQFDFLTLLVINVMMGEVMPNLCLMTFAIGDISQSLLLLLSPPFHNIHQGAIILIFLIFRLTSGVLAIEELRIAAFVIVIVVFCVRFNVLKQIF
jgi:hypothetical protein